jgi:hypothetical protein
MALQMLQLKPGINREVTTLANEGGWYHADKVRFRAGYPQKIGGWVLDTGRAVGSGVLAPPTGRFWGVARALHNWQDLRGQDLLAIGTNMKLYVQRTASSDLHDVTPLRHTSSATLAATDGSDLITVNDTGSAAQVGDFVVLSGAVGLGGAITAGMLNREHRVVAVSSASEYTIQMPQAANVADTGDGGPDTEAQYQIYTGAASYTIGLGWGVGGWGMGGWGEGDTSAAIGIGQQLRTWSIANYGEDLIANPRGGGIYLWKQNPNPNIYDRAVLLSPTSPAPYTTDAYAPVTANFVMVSDVSRFVIAFGANPIGSSVLDPLLIRWSDQENYALWWPAVTNQAGDFRLSQGSQIIGAQQTRQEVLVWTDTALYSMQYQGPPTVFGVQFMGAGLSIAGPNAMVTTNDVTYWMGRDSFYMYNGRVQPLRCDVRQFVFDGLNYEQLFQVTAGVNTAFGEVWWFYCGRNQTINDRYVVYNYLEDIWYYGSIGRTAWVDVGLRPNPIAASSAGVLVYHEVGTDDGSVNPSQPLHAFIESSDFDLGDGQDMSFARRIVPDVSFDGSGVSAPAVTFTLRPRRFPGTGYSPAQSPRVESANDFSGQPSYLVQRFTPQVHIRARGRQMALRIESIGGGVQWKLGVPRIDIQPDGGR